MIFVYFFCFPFPHRTNVHVHSSVVISLRPFFTFLIFQFFDFLSLKLQFSLVNLNFLMIVDLQLFDLSAPSYA
jgi:hypothetical protein